MSALDTPRLTGIWLLTFLDLVTHGDTRWHPIAAARLARTRVMAAWAHISKFP